MSLQDYAKLMEYLEKPRTRKELQEFCNYNSRDYFRTKILKPLDERKCRYVIVQLAALLHDVDDVKFSMGTYDTKDTDF